jgi:hypothetical protein
MLAGKISALKYFPNCFWDSARWEARWLNGRRGGSIGGVVAQWEAWWLFGRRGSSTTARQIVVLQSWVRIWRLHSPQLIANLLVGCYPGWHLAAG